MQEKLKILTIGDYKDSTLKNYNEFLLARDELLLKQLKKILLEK